MEGHVQGGGGGIPGTGVQLFFRGVPPEGRGGGYGKKSREIFFRTPKPEIPQLYPISLGLEGARRIFFKVTIDVSADMGGSCVLGHKDARSVPAVQRRPWPLIGKPKSGRKCYITLHSRGSPTKGTSTKAQKHKKATKPKIKNFHSHPTCNHGDCQPWELNASPSHQRGTVYPCLPSRVQAISDSCLHRDGIDIWSNMVFIHY